MEPGVVQRFVWDLELPGATIIPRAKVDTGNPADGFLAPPGQYAARLTVDGKAQTVRFIVRPNPRVKVDLTSQSAFATQIRDDFARLAGAVQQLRAVRKQLLDRNDLLAGDDRGKDLVAASKDLIGKLDALEEKLHNPKAKVTYDIFGPKGGAKLYSQYAFLFEAVKEGDGPPTQGMRQVYDVLAAELGKLTGEFQSLVAGDLAKLNAKAKELDLPVVLVPKIKPTDGAGGTKARRD
jgi:hypothetical protein